MQICVTITPNSGRFENSEPEELEKIKFTRLKETERLVDEYLKSHRPAAFKVKEPAFNTVKGSTDNRYTYEPHAATDGHHAATDPTRGKTNKHHAGANEEVDDTNQHIPAADMRQNENSQHYYTGDYDTKAGTIAHASSQNKTIDETEKPISSEKAGELLGDEHLPSNSEGKVHLSEEEQLLSNNKPNEQAGGAHQLPLETMQQETPGYSSSSTSSDESSPSENKSRKYVRTWKICLQQRSTR